MMEKEGLTMKNQGTFSLEFKRQVVGKGKSSRNGKASSAISNGGAL
jgi:hypothetical protein